MSKRSSVFHLNSHYSILLDPVLVLLVHPETIYSKFSYSNLCKNRFHFLVSFLHIKIPFFRLISLPLWSGSSESVCWLQILFLFQEYFLFWQLQRCFGYDFVIQSSLEMIFASFISNRRCRCAMSSMSWLHNCVQRSKKCCHPTKKIKGKNNKNDNCEPHDLIS